MSTNNKRAEYIKGLRAIVDLLENCPQIPTPQTELFCVWIHDKDQYASALKKTGHWEKVESNFYFFVRQRFGPIRFEVNINHEKLCRRVVIGTRVVPEQPAVAEHEEEIVEWKCPQSLLSLSHANE